MQLLLGITLGRHWRMRKFLNRNILKDHKGFSETGLKLEIVSGFIFHPRYQKEI